MTTVTITAEMVNNLRHSTGAGIMDCKKALLESQGNVDQAVDILRKKGSASAAKKAGRTASEGVVESYIHTGGRIGVLVELNCETDFVAQNDQFKQLARDIAIHIAALNPAYVSPDQIPAEVLEKEREIALEQAKGKPEAALQKIVEGKLATFAKDNCLMEQAFFKRPELTVGQLITEAIAKTGENIVVRHFTRYQVK
jgi:elongation factor Ts